MRIGLLGGSFNPAHEGHLHISVAALKSLGLDQVWWLVAPQNPLKDPKDMQPFAERMKTAQAMARSEPRIRVSDLQQKRGYLYTFDTVRFLRRHFPKTEFVWIMGADNLAQLHRWHNWRRLMRLIPFAVFDRASGILNRNPG
jgi:nicotinate-nucleotide adenylyltransferase